MKNDSRVVVVVSGAAAAAYSWHSRYLWRLIVELVNRHVCSQFTKEMCHSINRTQLGAWQLRQQLEKERRRRR